MKAAGKNRHDHRDGTMILVRYRHGLRVSELVSLEWSQVDFTAANLHVRRLKGNTDAVHPIRGDELRALRRLQREQQPKSAFIFVSERGSPFSTAGFLRLVWRLLSTGGRCGDDGSEYRFALRLHKIPPTRVSGYDERAEDRTSRNVR